MLVAACRDDLTVIRAKKGIRYEDDLGPVIQEAEDLSQRLGVVWTDALQAYRWMDYDHRTVIHEDGMFRRTASTLTRLSVCRHSCTRGCGSSAACSKRSLEQAAHTFAASGR